MKSFLRVFFLLLGINTLFVSCDIVYSISVRNYTDDQRVVVNYTRSGSSTWSDSDTLRVFDHIDSNSLYVVRNNIDSNSYSFMAVKNRTTYLQPKSLGSPITSVSLELGNDSIREIVFYGKRLKELKKKGIVTTRGLIFPYGFTINIR